MRAIPRWRSVAAQLGARPEPASVLVLIACRPASDRGDGVAHAFRDEGSKFRTAQGVIGDPPDNTRDTRRILVDLVKVFLSAA